MQIINKNDIENIKRMQEIVKLYKITKQYYKCEKYYKTIIEICDKYPQNEKALTMKMQSLSQLNKNYKSLQTTNTLLNINPKNLDGLVNLSKYIKEW